MTAPSTHETWTLFGGPPGAAPPSDAIAGAASGPASRGSPWAVGPARSAVPRAGRRKGATDQRRPLGSHRLCRSPIPRQAGGRRVGRRASVLGVRRDPISTARPATTTRCAVPPRGVAARASAVPDGVALGCDIWQRRGGNPLVIVMLAGVVRWIATSRSNAARTDRPERIHGFGDHVSGGRPPARRR
jgi:hypothetical protein